MRRLTPMEIFVITVLVLVAIPLTWAIYGSFLKPH